DEPPEDGDGDEVGLLERRPRAPRAPGERVRRALEHPAVDGERDPERERQRGADREEATPLDVRLDRGRRDDREPEPDEREVAAQLAAREPGADDGREQECVAPPGELEAEEYEGRGRDTERGREGAARGTVESHVREGSSVALVAGSVAVGHTAVGHTGSRSTPGERPAARGAARPLERCHGRGRAVLGLAR